MNFEKFTIKSQEAIQKAIEIAQENGSQAIETPHLFKGVILAGARGQVDIHGHQRCNLR